MKQSLQASLKSYLTPYVDAVKTTFTDSQFALLEQMANVVISALKNGRKVLLCGNGGSAADAQHIAAELIGRFKQERKSLPAIALTTDTSILTAMANDYSYDVVFSRQVEGLGEAGDILIAISTSGNSKNVLEAVRKAKSLSIKTLGFTGKNGGKLKPEVDLNFSGASDETSHIQTTHQMALHAICFLIDNEFSG